MAAWPLAAVAVAGSLAVDARRTPATAEQEIGYGSNNPSFRRHFWRGQAYHGPKANLGGGVRRGDTEPAHADALVDGRT